MTGAQIEQIYQDVAAQKIGQEYKKGKEAYLKCGEMLELEFKKRGTTAFKNWIETNKHELGFGIRTAYRLRAWKQHPEWEPSQVWGYELASAVNDTSPLPAMAVDQNVASKPAPKSPVTIEEYHEQVSNPISTPQLNAKDFRIAIRYVVNNFRNLPKSEVAGAIAELEATIEELRKWL